MRTVACFSCSLLERELPWHLQNIVHARLADTQASDVGGREHSFGILPTVFLPVLAIHALTRALVIEFTLSIP